MPDNDRCKDCGKFRNESTYCARSGRRHKNRSPSPVDERKDIWIHPPGRSSPPRNRSKSTEPTAVWQGSVLVTPVSKASEPTPRSPASRAKYELQKATESAEAALAASFQEQLAAEEDAESYKQSTALSYAQTDRATSEALQQIARSEADSHAETMASSSPADLLSLASEQYKRTEAAREELQRQKDFADQARADALRAEEMRRDVENEVLKAAEARKKAEAAEAAAAAIAKELEEVKAQKELLEASIAQSKALRNTPMSPVEPRAQHELPSSPVHAQYTGQGPHTQPQMDTHAAAKPILPLSPPCPTQGSAQLQNVLGQAAQTQFAQVQGNAQAHSQSLFALPASPTRQYTSPPIRSPPVSAPRVPESLNTLPYTPHASEAGAAPRGGVSMSPPLRHQSPGVLLQGSPLSPYRSSVLDNTKERLVNTLSDATDLSQELTAARALALQALQEKEREKETRLAAERQVQHAASTLDTLRLANEELQKALHDTKKELQDAGKQKSELDDIKRSLLAMTSERDVARATASQVYNELSLYVKESASEKDSLRSVVATLKGLAEERRTDSDAALIQSIVRQELSALQPTETEESLRQALIEERRARASVEEQLQKQSPYTEEALRHALGEEKKNSEAFREALNKEREHRLNLEKEREHLLIAQTHSDAEATRAFREAFENERQIKETVEEELSKAESIIRELQQKVISLQQVAHSEEGSVEIQVAEVLTTVHADVRAHAGTQAPSVADAFEEADESHHQSEVDSSRIAELEAMLEAESKARKEVEQEVLLLRADKTPETLQELKNLLLADRQQSQEAAKVQEDLVSKENQIAAQQAQLAREQSARQIAEEDARKIKDEMQKLLDDEKQLRISAQEELLKMRERSSDSDNQKLNERLDLLSKSEDTFRSALGAEQQLRKHVEQELEKARLLIRSQDPCDAVAALTAAHEELMSQKAVIEELQRALHEEQHARHHSEDVANSKTYLEEGLRRALSDEQRKRAAVEDELSQHRSFAALSHNENMLQKKLQEAQEARSVIEDENRRLQKQVEEAQDFANQLNAMIEAEKDASHEKVNAATLALKKREEELVKKDQDRKMLAQREVGLFREEHARLKALIEAKETDMNTEKNKIRTLQERLKESRLLNKRGAEERKRIEQELLSMEDQLAAARSELRRAKDNTMRAGEQRQKAEAKAKMVDSQEETILELQRELRAVKKQLRLAREQADTAVRERDAAFEETSCVEGVMEKVQHTMHQEAARIRNLQNSLKETEAAKEQADQDVLLLKKALIEANDAVNQSHMHLEVARREISMGPELRDRSQSRRSQSVPFCPDSPSLSPSRGLRGGVEVAFEDAVTGEYHVFNLSEWLTGAIQYTSNNEARPPTRRMAYDPVKGTLRLIDTGRHVTLPLANRAELVAGLRQLADQAGIPHNIAHPQRNRSVSPALPTSPPPKY